MNETFVNETFVASSEVAGGLATCGVFDGIHPWLTFCCGLWTFLTDIVAGVIPYSVIVFVLAGILVFMLWGQLIMMMLRTFFSGARLVIAIAAVVVLLFLSGVVAW